MGKIPDKESSRGFTLIELLVVIAIIGILASVVLASLDSARNKGIDTAVKSNLKGIREQAAIFYDDSGYTYSGLCATDSNVLNAMSGSMNTVSEVVTLGGLGDGECVDSPSAYAAWINLKLASTSAWCVDSEGTSGIISLQDSSSVDLTTCP